MGTRCTGTTHLRVSSVTHDTKPIHHSSWLDEDSHAEDMHCAGTNFTVLSFTGYTCDVDPFLEWYEMTNNVEIAKTATAIQLSASKVIYLVSPASLWFGDHLEHSLFNANIARDAGLEVCMDPMDPNRQLSIQDQERGLSVPMVHCGNCVGLETFKPD